MKKNTIWITLFIVPTALIFMLIYLVPLIMLLYTSFTDWSLGSKITFIGFGNYINLFTNDTVFKTSLLNTLIWVLLNCVINVGVGVITALITAKNNKFMKFAKTVYLLPNQISIAALSIILFFLFNPSVGPVNKLIGAMLHKEFNYNWFFEPRTAFLTVTFSTILYAGVVTLLVASEISAISESIFESAKIDGANEWQTNVFITIPMLRNIMGTCLILAATGALKSFEVIFLTTNGGPGNVTMNLSLDLYRTAMTANQYGYSNAIGTIILILGVGIIYTINKSLGMGKSDI